MRLLIPLFSPATGTWGGLTRMLAIAKAAQGAGHSVAFCAAGSLETVLRERGFKVYPTPPSTFLGLPASISRILEKRSQSTTLPVKPGRSFGSIWFVYWLSGMARTGYLHAVVEAERRAAQDFAAEALFTDLDPGAYLLRRLTGLPLASAYQTVLRQGVGSLPWKAMNRAVGGVLKKYNLPQQSVHELFFGPKTLKIIPSIPELEGEDPNRPDVCYVGHLLGEIKASRPQDFTPEPGKRYVFVYMGTGAVSLETVRQVLPELLPEGGPLRAIVGAQSITRVERIGAVEFRPYVPAEALLPHCDWTICHGGQNTIIQSLLNGVPLIVFPGPIFERRFNAGKVEQSGAGVVGEIPDFNGQWLSRVLPRQAECAQGARALGEKIRTYGGAVQAVRVMEEWVGRG